jgi:hypothetical protein
VPSLLKIPTTVVATLRNDFHLESGVHLRQTRTTMRLAIAVEISITHSPGSKTKRPRLKETWGERQIFGKK